MKKLLTLAVAILAAVCVQAASTSWNWSVMNIEAEDDAGDSGFAGYVTGTVELIAAGAGGTLSSSFDDSGTAEGTATGDTTGAFASGTPWQMKVTVNVGGTDYTKVIDFTMPAGLTGDIQGDSGIFSDLNGTLNNQIVPDGYLATSTMESNGWAKGEVVPEPTSVALLALGLAALGLKRKVA